MPLDVLNIAHIPKRLKRFEDPALPGKTQRLRMGKTYIQAPDAAVAQFDEWDAGRPDSCYRGFNPTAMSMMMAAAPPPPEPEIEDETELS